MKKSKAEAHAIGFVVFMGLLAGISVMVIAAAIDATMLHVAIGGACGFVVAQTVSAEYLKSKGWRLVRTEEPDRQPPKE